MRGHCLKSSWGVKTSLTNDINKLEGQLRTLEIAADGNPTRWSTHRTTQKELAELYYRLGNVDYKAFLRRQHMEEDKPGRTLAWLLKSETPQTVIGAIRNSEGGVVNTQEGINEVFKQYYTKLYRSPP